MDIRKSFQKFWEYGLYAGVGITGVITIIEKIDKLNTLLPPHLALVLFRVTLLCIILLNIGVWIFKPLMKNKEDKLVPLEKVKPSVNVSLATAGLIFCFYAFFEEQPGKLPVFDPDYTGLKIAFFPPAADRENHLTDANYLKQFREYLGNEKTSENYHFKVIFDSLTIPETKEAAIARGESMQADVVVWGSYEEPLNGMDSMRIQYAITGNFTTYIDSSKRETDTEMKRLTSLSQLRQGYLLEQVDYLINWFEGMAAFQKYDYTEAAKYFDKAHSIDYAGQYGGQTNHLLIDLYQELGQYSMAKTYCEKLIVKQQKEGDTLSDDHASTLIVMGSLLNALKKEDSAWTYLKKGIEKMDTNPVTDSMTRALAYSDYGTFWYGTRDTEKATLAYQKALPYFNEKNPLHAIGIAILNYNIGIIKVDGKFNEEGLAFINRATDIQNKIPNPNLWFSAKIYNVLGNLYSQTGAVKKALLYYKEALNIYLTLHHEDAQLASLYSNLGNCFCEINEKDSSIKYNYGAVAVMKKINDTTSTVYANILLNLGEALKYKENYKEALALTQRAEKIYHTYPPEKIPIELTTVNINIAELNLLLDSIATCQTYLAKTKAVLDTSILKKGSTYFNPDNYLIGYYYWACAKLERKKNNTSGALEMAEKAYQSLASNFGKDHPHAIEVKKLMNALSGRSGTGGIFALGGNAGLLCPFCMTGLRVFMISFVSHKCIFCYK